MKKLQMLALMVVMLISGTTLGQSKEEINLKKAAIKELKKDIKKQFRNMPFSEIMGENDECCLSIRFRINDEGIVEYSNILGENEKLVDYSKRVLSNKEINMSVLYNKFFIFQKLNC